jgi:hypothetical protein
MGLGRIIGKRFKRKIELEKLPQEARMMFETKCVVQWAK